jgi:tRNA-uridine 2-sulfurtransferase
VLPSPPKTVLVAMSGGVDSSVAAALLKERGHRVIGAFMRNGVKAGEASKSHRQGCCGVDDAFDARRVADQLDVPFYAVDLEEDFGRLIDEFTDAYRRGRTPNPCVECNRSFKFGRLLKLAREIGAEAVATGHYARVAEKDGRLAVGRARDLAKDQSYVLFPLGQEALRAAMFPLAEMTKQETRAEARRFGLKTAEKPESMEICFVPTGDYRDVVRARAPEAFVPGPIVARDGTPVGVHEGVAGFTVGQRRRLPGGRAEPLYVVALDPVTNTVIVGSKEDLASDEARLEEVVFSGAAPRTGARLRGAAKIRHQHEPVAASAEITSSSTAVLRFDEPVFAVTPGQAAVLYDGDGRVLCGGWIGDAARSV